MDVDASEQIPSDGNTGNDFVVKEIDVYLAKSLSKNLYLLQYPIRPIDMTYDDATYCASRIKPKQNKIELEITLDTKSQNYSKTKGEQFALNVDGKSNVILQTPQQQRYYKSNLMDKQVLVSSDASLNEMNKRYAIAILKNNELHVTPLKSIVQMKPSFEYFDIYEKKIKDVKETQNDTDYSTEEDDIEADKTELVTLKYAKEPLKTKEENEEEQVWIQTKYSNTKTKNSLNLKNSLFCNTKSNDVSFEHLNVDYLNKLLGINVNISESNEPNAQDIS